ncbi:hypothetical protein IAT38_004427 [Cryptococcus sp. DSM 104549]
MFRLRVPAFRPRALPLRPARRYNSTAPSPHLTPTATPPPNAHPTEPLVPSHTFTKTPYKPPPLSARLKPLIPFFIYWTILTSLIVHLLRTRLEREEMLAHQGAKEGVLRGLVERVEKGERVGDAEVQREMELVGLRKKGLGWEGVGKEELGPRGREYVGWKEVFLGKKTKVEEKEGEPEEEKTIEQEWAEVVEAAETESAKPTPGFFASLFTPPKMGRVPEEVLVRERTLEAKRAPGSSAYL